MLALLCVACSDDDPVTRPAEPDTSPPSVSAVSAVDESHVMASFSEVVDAGSAVATGSYEIFEASSDERLPVLGVVLNNNRRSVTIAVSEMKPTLYEITVRYVEDVHGNGMGSEGSRRSFDGSTVPDETAPEIIGRSPAPGATHAPLGSAIEIEFSDAVFFGTGNVTVAVGGTDLQAGVVSQDGYARYKVYAPLEVSTQYTVTITGVQDFAGNPMLDAQWSFITTEEPDNTPPTFLYSSPSNDALDVRVDTRIILYFSEMIDRASFAPVITPAVAGEISWWPDRTWCSLRPNSELLPETEYTVSLPIGSVKDVAGNSDTEAVTVTFTTRSAPATHR